MRHRIQAGGLLLVAAICLPGCDGDECPSLQDEASALFDDAAACSGGDVCVLVDMYELAGADNCLGPFQCHRAINAATDLEAFRADARRIAADYRGCGACVVADCVGPGALVARCDAEAGSCVVEEAAR